MKIKIHKNDLNNILNIMEVGLTNFNVIESLKGIKINVTTEKISFITSKSEMAIIYEIKPEEINIEIEREGEVIIPGFQFINIIKKLNSTYINLEANNNTLNIQTNKTHIQLITFDKNSYPTIKFNLNEPKILKIKKQVLYTSYNKTKYSIDNNPVNPILTGINFNFNNNLTVSSTDSLRMTLYKTDEQTNENIDFTINKNLLKDLLKILQNKTTDKDNDLLNLEINNNQLLINDENLKVKVRLLDGKYPEIQKIIPQNINFSYNINKINIQESLERVLLLTEKSESIVICDVENEILSLKTSHKFLGKIEEQCKITNLNGNPFKIAFDPYFVLEAIKTIEDEEIKMEFIDEISGFIITTIDNQKIINVISPIRMD